MTDDFVDMTKDINQQKAITKKILKKTGLKDLTDEELDQLRKERDYTTLLESKKSIIGDKKVVLQDHQKKFIESFLYSNLRSAIMFHGVGTGKTFTAVACVKSYMQLYPNNNVIVITPPALLFNFIDSMIAYGVDPRDKKFSYYSYVSFINKKVETKNALLIIDEAHNLRTEVNIVEDDEGKIMGANKGARPYETIIRSMKCHKVLLMTATPFINKPYDCENLLAIGDGRMPYSEDIFGTMISDPEVRYDYFKYRISKFINPENNEDFPNKIEKYVPIVVDRLSKESQKIYAQSNRKTNPAYVYSRQASINSDKIDFVKKKIMSNPTKKYVIYVSFHRSIEKIKKIFSKVKEKVVEISGNINLIDKAIAIDTYNNFENKDSEYYKKSRIMIISKAGAEGVSLQQTRGIFIMDGVWNEALYTQIVARAIRYKSHDKLPKKERYVEVYKLFYCFDDEAVILEKLNKGGSFNFNKFLEDFATYKKVLKQNKDTFNFMDFEQTKKGSVERKKLLQSMDYAKGRAGYITQDLMSSFRGTPSTDFYMFVLEKSKQDVIDRLLIELERAPNLEKIISDIPEVKKLYNKSQRKFKSGKNVKIIEELQKILGTEEAKAGRKLKRIIDANESNLVKYIEKKKEVSSLLKAKIKRRIKQEFFTPTKYVNELIDLSGINNAKPNQIYNILEPSAGYGNIVKVVMNVAERKKLNIDFDLVEIQNDNRKELKQIEDIIPHMIHLQKEPDFIQFLSSKKYDYVFMNPPFHLQQKNNKQYNKDVYSFHFVMRAYAMLKKNGVLVAITGREWKDNKEAVKFYKDVNAKTIDVQVDWSDDKALKKGMEIKKLDITFIRIDKVDINPNQDNDLLEYTNKLVAKEKKTKGKTAKTAIDF